MLELSCIAMLQSAMIDALAVWHKHLCDVTSTMTVLTLLEQPGGSVAAAVVLTSTRLIEATASLVFAGVKYSTRIINSDGRLLGVIFSDVTMM